MSLAHEKVEKNVGLLAVLIAVVVSFGGLAEIVPLMYQAEAIEPLPGVKPYPPLEL
ncbi:cbb3-type cytochrome c oxidase subunit II, partial [Acinetobacter baumannii]